MPPPPPPPPAAPAAPEPLLPTAFADAPEEAPLALVVASGMGGAGARAGKGGATIVHGYTLHETLGTGTFGRVRRATKDGASYAIKIVSRQQLAATSMTPQLKREVAIQKSLVHPSIVQLRQVLRSPNKLYMVLELAAEGELYWAIQRNGPLSPAAARRALFQLADALYYCHERGVVHRDVKPENVLLDHRHNIKLTDFGLSSSSDPAHAHAYGGVDLLPDPRLLRTACGSPHYCAPEVRSPGPAGTYDGPKADAWSVGVVLFLMINGFLPFHDDDPQILQEMVESHPVAFPDTMPEQPRHICEHLLVRDSSRRWSLDRVLAHPWIAADPTLVRAVSHAPSPTAPSATASHLSGPPSAAAPPPAAPAAASKAPEGWYTFGRLRDLQAHASAARAVPREEALPEDDGSFSDVDSNAEDEPVILKPRRKSMLSVRSRPRIARESFGHNEQARARQDDDGLGETRRDSHLRPAKRSTARRGLGTLMSSSREAPPHQTRHSTPVPHGDAEERPSRRVSKLVRAKRLLSGAGLSGSRKAAYPVQVPV